MENSVKFRRGTMKEFVALSKKDPNTLYFISDGDKNLLFLGDKPVVENNETNLLDLTDVDLSSELQDGSQLIYDAATQTWRPEIPTALRFKPQYKVFGSEKETIDFIKDNLSLAKQFTYLIKDSDNKYYEHKYIDNTLIPIGVNMLTWIELGE